jgi:hypothetical protein
MRWAPLEADGWRQRPDGWFVHPEYEDTLRSADGLWWIKSDVDEGKVEMTLDGPRRAPGWFVESTYPFRWVREPDPPADETDEIRARLEEVTGE